MNDVFSFSLACLFLVVGTSIPLYLSFRHKLLIKQDQRFLSKQKQKVELKLNLFFLLNSLPSPSEETSSLVISIVEKIEQASLCIELELLLFNQLTHHLQTSSPLLVEYLYEIEQSISSYSHSSMTS